MRWDEIRLPRLSVFLTTDSDDNNDDDDDDEAQCLTPGLLPGFNLIPGRAPTVKIRDEICWNVGRLHI